MTDGQENNSPDDTITPLANPSSRLFRSQSIQDQLNRPPRVTPAHWGHSLSKSYGGNDWPLPASGSIGSPTFSNGPAEKGEPMDVTPIPSDQLWPSSNTAKKRGPKPKNEPAATVRLR